MKGKLFKTLWFQAMFVDEMPKKKRKKEHLSSHLGLVLFLVLIFVCVVSILAGILNITAKSGR
mgnify:CR=1 FL=1